MDEGGVELRHEDGESLHVEILELPDVDQLEQLLRAEAALGLLQLVLELFKVQIEADLGNKKLHEFLASPGALKLGSSIRMHEYVLTLSGSCSQDLITRR